MLSVEDGLEKRLSDSLNTVELSPNTAVLDRERHITLNDNNNIIMSIILTSMLPSLLYSSLSYQQRQMRMRMVVVYCLES